MIMRKTEHIINFPCNSFSRDVKRVLCTRSLFNHSFKHFPGTTKQIKPMDVCPMNYVDRCYYRSQTINNQTEVTFSHDLHHTYFPSSQKECKKKGRENAKAYQTRVENISTLSIPYETGRHIYPSLQTPYHPRPCFVLIKTFPGSFRVRAYSDPLIAGKDNPRVRICNQGNT